MKVLIVDDEPRHRRDHADLVESLNHQTERMSSMRSVLEKSDEFLNGFDVALIDKLIGGDEDGLALGPESRRRAPALHLVLVTAHGTGSVGFDAAHAGFYKCIDKPLDRDAAAKLLDAIQKAKDLSVVTYKKYGLIGPSLQMKRVKDVIVQYASSSAPVFITGETGVGKEIVARAIHMASGRKDNEFVPVNCAGIPDGLKESELFGRERGAYTGALTSKAGLFEFANRGTIFLDEIAELSPTAQAALLRVLQERTVRRLGSLQERESDFRVIAATNRDIPSEVRQGTFREDLFYRLSVLDIHVPPLRERVGDVETLAEYFVRRKCEEERRKTLTLPSSAKEALATYHWPGNVRQLENVIHKLVVLHKGDGFIEAEEIRHLLPLTDTLKLKTNDSKFVGVSPRVVADGIYETLDKTLPEGAVKAKLFFEKVQEVLEARWEDLKIDEASNGRSAVELAGAVTEWLLGYFRKRVITSEGAEDTSYLEDDPKRAKSRFYARFAKAAGKHGKGSQWPNRG